MNIEEAMMKALQGKLVESVEDYSKLKNEKGTCPFCNGNNLGYDAIQFEGDMSYFPWKCEDCGHKGEEWYDMTFAGHNVYDENDDLIELQESKKVTEDYDDDDEEKETFFVELWSGDNKGTVKIFYEDGKWREKVVDGNLDQSDFNKTYQGYMSKEDIIGWLENDFGVVTEVDCFDESKKVTESKEEDYRPVELRDTNDGKVDKIIMLNKKHSVADLQNAIIDAKEARAEEISENGDDWSYISEELDKMGIDWYEGETIQEYVEY